MGVVVVGGGMAVVGEGGVVVGEGEFELGVVESGGGLSFLRRMVAVLLGRAMNEEGRPFGIGDSVSKEGH